LVPHAELQEDFSGRLRYSLPKAEVVLSKLFASIEESRSLLHIQDYSISQTTLEQVFLTLARLQNDSNVYTLGGKDGNTPLPINPPVAEAKSASEQFHYSSSSASAVHQQQQERKQPQQMLGSCSLCCSFFALPFSIFLCCSFLSLLWLIYSSFVHSSLALSSLFSPLLCQTLLCPKLLFFP
jgi:hypothetical protein